MFRKKVFGALGFSRQREFICRRAMSEGGGPRHPMVRLPPGYSPSLLWTPSSCQVNRNFGFRFVQFR
jgi:hypothetical protein